MISGRVINFSSLLLLLLVFKLGFSFSIQRNYLFTSSFLGSSSPISSLLSVKPYRKQKTSLQMVLVIGLTGGICSGKTTITKILQEEQKEFPTLKIINADIVGHQVYQKGTKAYHELIQTFGEQILNSETQEIDRPKLGGIVFQDPSQMKRLTDIVWPEIALLVQKQIQQFEIEEQETKQLIPVIVEAAVLFEAKWNPICHKIWLCCCNEEVALDRLLKRNPHLTPQQAKDRIQSQMTMLEEKRSLSSRIIENNLEISLEDLRQLVHSYLVEDIANHRHAT
jgi:dephospho-CoA kinase